MRIRSIKPEFWRSDDITSLLIEDRLLFIGLWSYVDDNGVGRDKLADICADLFAHDLSVNPHGTLTRIEDGLKHLHAGDLITRYSVENRPYLYIRQWKTHQKINRPSPGRYPPPTSGNAAITEPSVSDHAPLSEPSRPGAGEQRNRGTEEQGIKDSSKPAALDTRNDYPAEFEDFWFHYPRKDQKRDALKAWQAALKRASNAELIEGAQRYANDPNLVESYTKLPAGWLRADMWLDGPLPPRNQGSQSGPTRQDSKVLDYFERGQRLAAAARNQNTQQLEIS